MSFLWQIFQDIAVYAIISAAFAAALYKIYIFFKAPAPSCASCCKDCPYSKKK